MYGGFVNDARSNIRLSPESELRRHSQKDRHNVEGLVDEAAIVR